VRTEAQAGAPRSEGKGESGTRSESIA
jgi:hypothetical protein